MKGVKLGQFGDGFGRRRVLLGNLLVHRNGFDREAFAGISLATAFETLGGLLSVSDLRIKVTEGIQHVEVARVFLGDLFKVGNGVVQLPLLDTLLRRSKGLSLVKTKTEHHKLTPPRLGRTCTEQLIDSNYHTSTARRQRRKVMYPVSSAGSGYLSVNIP
jgi:hypothetical protein